MKPGLTVKSWRDHHRSTAYKWRRYWIIRNGFKENGPFYIGGGYSLVEAMRAYLMDVAKEKK